MFNAGSGNRGSLRGSERVGFVKGGKGRGSGKGNRVDIPYYIGRFTEPKR